MEINPLDVEHDDIVGDVLVRILSARVVDDPLSKDKKDQSLWLQVDILPEELFHICLMVEKSFQQQEVLLEIDRSMLPVHVVADLHGQVSHVLRLLHTVGSPQRETYLFLGDYVDRGAQGIELMLLLFCLKIRYPFQVFLLRGNHEDVNTNLNYGFYEECLLRYNRYKTGLGEKVWRAFLGAFNWMPLAAIISGKKGRIFCCHGGISPFLNRLEDINAFQRPSIIPPFGIGCDLVWADPSTFPGWAISHRGISFVFGQDVLEQFCRRHCIDIVLRGHQINEKMYRYGYKINPGGRLITFFSAPNYMNYKNNAAIIRIDQNFRIQFKVFRVKVYNTPENMAKKKSTLSLFRKKLGKTVKKESSSKSNSGETDTEVDGIRELVDNKYKPARNLDIKVPPPSTAITANVVVKSAVSTTPVKSMRESSQYGSVQQEQVISVDKTKEDNSYDKEVGMLADDWKKNKKPVTLAKKHT